MEAIIAIVIAAFGYLGFEFMKTKKENKELQLKEVENVAKETVENKTTSELADDFNKRYGSGDH